MLGTGPLAMNRWQCGGRAGNWEKQKQETGLRGWGEGRRSNPRSHLFQKQCWTHKAASGELQVQAVISLPDALFKNYFKITFKKLAIKSCQAPNTAAADPMKRTQAWLTTNRKSLQVSGGSGLSSLINPGLLITRNRHRLQSRGIFMYFILPIIEKLSSTAESIMHSETTD